MLSNADAKQYGCLELERALAMREGRGTMATAGLFVIGVACVRFQTPHNIGFAQKCHFSLLSTLGHCFDVVSLDKVLHPGMLHLTQL